ncbi:MAG TPA: GDSL-type esterase/lipase family protein [Chitinophagaceae bacterium]|nr:GDSL-type esterase/lipase family protein [Chitinophagaceae bacterium]
MKSKRRPAYIFLFIFLLVAGLRSFSQAYVKDFAAFKRQDSLHAPPVSPILFIGSSSFTKWKDVQNYFPSYPIINRGFGGSTLRDQVRYADIVVFPYQPKQIIVYCGENDLASSDTVTAQEVLKRFQKLFTLIRSKLPQASIVFISMKPSPSRQLLLGKMQEGNSLIKAFLQKQKNTDFIDVYKEMVDSEGKPMQDLFLDDNLHMNRKGYILWKKLIEPHLMK